MLYRSALTATLIGIVLLALAILSMVYISWTSVSRLDPINHHISLIEELESEVLELDNILQQDPDLTGDKASYALDDLIQRINQVSESKYLIVDETSTYLQLISDQLGDDNTLEREAIQNSILVLRGVIKTESRARVRLLNELYKNSQILFTTALWIAVTLVILSILCIQGIRIWLIRPLNDLSYLLKLIAQKDMTSAVISEVNPALKDIFNNYNQMVERLVQHEQSHASKELNLKRDVESMTRTLLQQHSALLRAQHFAMTGEITASLAHELRNPLSGMTVALTNLRQDLNDPDNVERLDMVIDELKRTTRLLNGLLEKTHRAPEKMTRISLSESVYTVFSLLKHQFSDRITLKSEIDQNLECLLPESGFRQVLMNLILNASQAIGDNDGEITVEAHMEDKNAYIKICDDGPGFPEDILHNGIRTFQSGRTGGTGLGLSMVKRFISDMDGTIELSNKSPYGACVSMIIPSERCN